MRERHSARCLSVCLSSGPGGRGQHRRSCSVYHSGADPRSKSAASRPIPCRPGLDLHPNLAFFRTLGVLILSCVGWSPSRPHPKDKRQPLVAQYPKSEIHKHIERSSTHSRSRSITDIRMEPKSLLLLVQVLHNPGFRGNKLGGRDTELHELSKGSRVTIVIGIVSFRKTRGYTRPNLLPEERVLILRVL
jgi:hypothetical protein